VGKVKSQGEDGIRGQYISSTTAHLMMKRAVTMTFFDEVHIDVSQLPAPSTLWVQHLHSSFTTITVHCSDSSRQKFFWVPSLDATASRHELMDSPLGERLYIDQDSPIRVRVEGDEFYEHEPGPPKATEGVRVDLTTEPKQPPYRIMVS
jgi:DNA-directed RNA polymerase III subunit RPC8